MTPVREQLRYVTGTALSSGNFQEVDLPLIVTCSFGNVACKLNALPVCLWHKGQLHIETLAGSGPTTVAVSLPHAQEAVRVFIVESLFILIPGSDITVPVPTAFEAGIFAGLPVPPLFRII